jgi:hypothetical protein
MRINPGCHPPLSPKGRRSTAPWYARLVSAGHPNDHRPTSNYRQSRRISCNRPAGLEMHTVSLMLMHRCGTFSSRLFAFVDFFYFVVVGVAFPHATALPRQGHGKLRFSSFFLPMMVMQQRSSFVFPVTLPRVWPSYPMFWLSWWKWLHEMCGLACQEETRAIANFLVAFSFTPFHISTWLI